MTVRKAIDVSAYQGVIDWDALADSIDYAIIRAGAGTSYVDDQFERNISECNRLKIPAGVYWFSYAENRKEAESEAQRCLSLIRPYRVELPVFFDYEYDSLGTDRSKEHISDIFSGFMQTVEHAGYFASFYTNKDFSSKYLDPALFDRFDCWWALWYDSADPFDPPIDSQNFFAKCGTWQYGTGTLPGILGAVDLDAVYKDYVGMIRDCGLNRLNDEPLTLYKDDIRRMLKYIEKELGL